MKKPIICAFMPHPPIMIPEIGKGDLDKVKATVAAAQQAATIIQQQDPQTIILITPHGPVFDKASSISIDPRLKGNFRAFGAPEVSLAFETDDLLTQHIFASADDVGINLVQLTDHLAEHYGLHLELDHGALVPLYYLSKAGFKGQLIHISVGTLSYEQMYTFGKAVQIAINQGDKRVAVIASGDLSHRLTPDAPAGYSPQAADFDKQVLQGLQDINKDTLLAIDKKLIREAGECGLRPIFFLLGVVDGMDMTTNLLSYEAPFGVGYAVGVMTRESSPVSLARASLHHFLDKGSVLPAPEKLDDMLAGRAGVFVSLKKQGQLRGCIGTFGPTRTNIGSEIIYNAISAGTADPRFEPVELIELPELTISVDILETPEPVNRIDDLDPQKYGIIVRNGSRSGLLLPMLEGVDTVDEQLSIAMQKAGIGPKEKIELYRFTVTRYK
ncbi:AmmeMemoRadiSam system protein A [Pelosinus sp. sgz500959]|uniref:AmmeMemoRadiSam system protein A n=1 Tax=Pelosinus sp. sgz500959 TaxID=3242472 RepID=UPI003672DC28